MIMEWYYNIILVAAIVAAGITVIAVVANNRYNRKSR